MDYIFKTGDVNTGALILDSNKEQLKTNYKEISRNIIQKGKVLYRDTKFTLYSDKKYILLDIPTDVKDHIGRTLPIVCILSLKDIKESFKNHENNLDEVITEILRIIENFSIEKNYPISNEYKERLREILKNYLPGLVGGKRAVYKTKINFQVAQKTKNNILTSKVLAIIAVIVTFFTSIFGVKKIKKNRRNS